MSNAFLLTRVRLQFKHEDTSLIHQLSAIAFTPDGHLWVGSDEFLTLERLSPLAACEYGEHQTFHLRSFLDLVDAESEVDIEGLSYSEGYLWVVGSHSAKRRKPKGKKQGEAAQKDIQRLAKVRQDANRYLLARIPVVDGQLVKTHTPNKKKEVPLTTACLGQTSEQNAILELLKQDEHLAPFVKAEIPSKDNGFDIEGLAVQGQQVFVGLRGPVLVGWAIILELELSESTPGELHAKPLKTNRPYRKHFVNLDGLGVRDLCLYQGDLFILAGPTMSLPGTLRVFRLRDALNFKKDTLWSQGDRLECLFDLPYNPGRDNAEGLAIFPFLGYENSLMVLYDAPDPQRCPDARSIFADVFRLPS